MDIEASVISNGYWKLLFLVFLVLVLIVSLNVVLVALYEQNDKPSSAIEFMQQKLGGPTLAEYEKLQADFSDLQIRYNELLAAHKEKSRECEELKNAHIQADSKDTAKEEAPSEGL